MKTSEKSGISLSTRIKVLLDADQENVIQALVVLNANFAKLRNPVLRHLFANRVSVADACRIAKCDPDAFLKQMENIGFKLNAPEQVGEMGGAEKDEISFYPRQKVIKLDVRPSLAANEDPLKVIMNAVKGLRTDECLKIINTFEPVPLIELLAERGFSYHTERYGPDLVITWFGKTDEGDETRILDIWGKQNEKPEDAVGPEEVKAFSTVLLAYTAEKIRYLDVRQLEMPLPMLRIMEQINNLAKDELLYVYHKKLPLFLLPEMEKKGLSYTFNKKSDTELDLLIFR